MNDKHLDKIVKFLKTQNETLNDYRRLYGGNNNFLYAINNKYFVKFKDELAVREEALYFENKHEYSPKLYYSSVKDKMLVYELLDAKDLEDISLVPNLIDIVLAYSKNQVLTNLEGFGYYGSEYKTWYDFLKNETDDSKRVLIKYLDKNDFNIVDKALENVKKYEFEKRIIHGDFGLHNTMITNDTKIYFIDPETVLGDYIYDFICYCFSDVTLLKIISFDDIINKIDENIIKVKSLMIIVMFKRLDRVLKYSKEDFDTYYNYWRELIK